MGNDDMCALSLWVPTSARDDLESMADEWDRHHDRKIKRSVPGRAALVAGIAFLQMLEQQYGTRRVATMGSRELAAAARQGAIEYAREDGE